MNIVLIKAYPIIILMTIIFFGSCKISKTPYVTSTRDIKTVKFAGFTSVQISSPLIAKGSPKIWMDVDAVNTTNISEFVDLINADNFLYYRGCYSSGCEFERATKKMKSKYLGCYLSEKYVNPRVILIKKKEIEKMQNLTISDDEERQCFCQMALNSSIVQSAVKSYDQRKEDGDFQYAMRSNSISSLEYFLQKYPSTQYKIKVKDKISEIEKIEKAKRESEAMAAKVESEKKRKMIQEHGGGSVYSKNWISVGLVGERQKCDIVFADDTEAKIELGPTGVYSFWAKQEQIYYDTENSAIKAVYQWKKEKILSHIGRVYPDFAEKSTKCVENLEKISDWKEVKFIFGGNEYKLYSDDLAYKFKCTKNSSKGVFVNLVYNTTSKSFWDNTDYDKGWYYYYSGMISTTRNGPYKSLDDAINKTCNCN